MWKERLARFHGRTPSIQAQSAPLIPSKSARPYSTTTLEPLQEQDRASDELPTAKNSGAPATASAEKADGPHDSPSQGDVESNGPSRMRSIKSFMMEELDTAQAPPPLSAYCFMTGFIDAVSFSAMFVWCAFQTGNCIQLSLAIARLFNGQHDEAFHIADRQAFCSLIAFILGAVVGRIGDKIGCKTRMWMVLGTYIQTLCTMIAAIALWKSRSGSVGDNRGDPAWSNALSFVTVGFVSASMGLQGIMGKRLNTQFTTTVVLTTTWCELMTEPKLFHVRHLVASRDHKVMAIFFLFLGGFISRALLDKIGSAATLGVATGLRFGITLWWLFIPAKKVKS